MKYTKPETKDFKNKGKRDNIEAYEKAYNVYCDQIESENLQLLEALKYIGDHANSKIIRGIAHKAIKNAEK